VAAGLVQTRSTNLRRSSWIRGACCSVAVIEDRLMLRPVRRWNSHATSWSVESGFGVATDFVDEVAGSLKPGKVAVVAEINEEWVTPVDTRMEALGGEVLRRARTEVIDAQIASEQAAMQEELADMKAEAAKATGEAKSRLQKRVDAAHARLQGLQSRAKAAHDADKEQMEAKLRVLQDRAARAKGEAKAGLQQRTEKLRKAWERTKERWGSHAFTDR
jgi:hypothetical protein